MTVHIFHKIEIMTKLLFFLQGQENEFQLGKGDSRGHDRVGQNDSGLIKKILNSMTVTGGSTELQIIWLLIFLIDL